MISIDNAALEQILKRLIISQQIEHQKPCYLVFQIESQPRSEEGSSNLKDYDLVGRFKTYDEKGEKLAELASDLRAATEELHARMNEVGRLATSLRIALENPRAMQVNEVRLRKGFEVLSKALKRSRPKKKR